MVVLYNNIISNLLELCIFDSILESTYIVYNYNNIYISEKSVFWAVGYAQKTINEGK